MKRLNPKTNAPFKRGDLREDGYAFRQYDLKNVDNNGYFYESWTKPTNLQNNREQINELSKIRYAALENDKRLKREWYERNKEITKERARARDLANPEQAAARKAKWRQENREQHNAANREWNKNNKPRKAALQAKRKSVILQRTPAWDPHAHLIIAKYQLAAMLTKASGIEHHVDHIIPLQGKNVSGLHVFSNLRVIPGSDNVKKSNKFHI